MNNRNDEIGRDISAIKNAEQIEKWRRKSAAMQAQDYELRNTTQQPEPSELSVEFSRQAMLVIVMIGTLCVLINACIAWKI